MQNTSSTKLFGVLTGDLVRSREMSVDQRKQVIILLKELAKDFAKLHRGANVGGIDVFRGDSWQYCLKQPELSVTAAVFIRVGLKMESLDSRVGIGIGPVETLNSRRISESTGSAFLLSGHALDTLEKGRRLGFAIPAGQSSPMRYLADLAIPLLDAQVGRWTQREALAVFGSLHGLTQQEIAEWPPTRAKHGGQPSRQAIQDALSRSRWQDLLGPVLKKLEGFLKAEKCL